MIAAEIYEAKGKTIKDVIAHDPFGYDCGFTLEFTDRTRLSITPTSYCFKTCHIVRINIERG